MYINIVLVKDNNIIKIIQLKLLFKIGISPWDYLYLG